MDGDGERWLLEVGPPRSHRWYANASSNIPDELLGALTTAATARSAPRRPPVSVLAYTTATRPTTLPQAALAQRTR